VTAIYSCSGKAKEKRRRKEGRESYLSWTLFEGKRCPGSENQGEGKDP